MVRIAIMLTSNANIRGEPISSFYEIVRFSSHGEIRYLYESFVKKDNFAIYRPVCLKEENKCDG